MMTYWPWMSWGPTK